MDVLRSHLAELWEDPDLWLDDEFLNWCAYDVVCCIEKLIDLLEEPADFEDKVRLLAEHPCEGLRDSCRRFLHKHYPWMQPPEPPSFFK